MERVSMEGDVKYWEELWAEMKPVSTSMLQIMEWKHENGEFARLDTYKASKDNIITTAMMKLEDRIS